MLNQYIDVTSKDKNELPLHAVLPKMPCICTAASIISITQVDQQRKAEQWYLNCHLSHTYDGKKNNPKAQHENQVDWNHTWILAGRLGKNSQKWLQAWSKN